MSTEEGGLEGSTETTEVSVGARLVAARSASGLTVAQVAQRLHCGRDLIEALEADRFADLGAPVFSRGHLRRYAELLGLSVEDMLAHLARQETREPPLPDLTQVPRAESRPFDWRALQPMALGAAAVAVFALAIWLVLTRTASVDESSSVTSASNVVAPTPASSGTASSTPAASPRAVSPSTASPSVTQAAPATPTPLVSEDAKPTDTAVANAETITESRWPARPTVISQRGGFSLAMSVDEACWVEIYDKDGNALFYDMAQPERRIQVSGAAPVRVRLGLAPAVTLEFLGRRMPVPPELIRESLAHFTLSADGRFTRYRPPPTTRSPSETRASGT